MLQYETNPDAIPLLLPDPFKAGKSPIVSVLFNDNNGVDFMAGGGYRLAAISVAAQFDGENGHFEGGYVLVMPENQTLPIITGREWLGMPKFFADISVHTGYGERSSEMRGIAMGTFALGIDIALG
jgi:acetoacetate decarboxylase